MLQRPSWLTLPFGPVPTISQSIARYFEGIHVDGCRAVGLWKLSTEGQQLGPLLPVTVEADGVGLDVEAVEVQSDESSVLPGRVILLFVEVEGDGCTGKAPLWCWDVWS